MSNRAAAAVINGFQQDTERITPIDRQFVVYPKKIERGRCAIREREVETRQSKLSGFTGLYFDGRKDVSYVMIRDNQVHLAEH